MALTDQAPRLAGTLDETTVVALRSTLERCYDYFRFYRERFQTCGINRRDIAVDDPIETLRRLPLLDTPDLVDLADEAVSVSEGIIDVETSSGTTGRRKIRYISYDDDQREHEFLARLFAITGVCSDDRVACLDTDPVNLMVSIAKAFDLLGVAEAYCLSAGAEFGQTVQAVEKLAPTVLCSVPSIIQRYISQAPWSQLRDGRPSFSKVIFIGEAMPQTTRRILEMAGVEVYGYYGASETSALGIECAAHDGIHIIQSRNVVELLPVPDDPTLEEVVVTTLGQFAQPLIRYRLGDRVRVLPGRCSCGLPDFRLDVHGKPDQSVSILGSKVGYGSIREAAYRRAEEVGPLQMVVSRTSIEVLDLVLPDTIKGIEEEILDSVMSAEPDLRFLRDSGFMNLSVSLVDPDHFTSDRKLKPIIDRRV